MLTIVISSWLEMMYLVFGIAIYAVFVMLAKPILTKKNAGNTLVTLIMRIENLEAFMRRIDSMNDEEAISKNIVIRSNSALEEIKITLSSELRNISDKITEIQELISLQNSKINLIGSTADRALSSAEEACYGP